jgi:hypothetical protein
MGTVRKIAAGLLVAVVLVVGAFVAVVLFVALVNGTSSGPEDPPDDGVYEDQLNDQLGRDASEEEARLRCEEAQEDVPGLNC